MQLKDRMEETDPSYQFTIAYDDRASETSGTVDQYGTKDKMKLQRKTTVIQRDMLSNR